MLTKAWVCKLFCAVFIWNFGGLWEPEDQLLWWSTTSTGPQGTIWISGSKGFLHITVVTASVPQGAQLCPVFRVLSCTLASLRDGIRNFCTASLATWAELTTLKCSTTTQFHLKGCNIHVQTKTSTAWLKRASSFRSGLSLKPTCRISHCSHRGANVNGFAGSFSDCFNTNCQVQSTPCNFSSG